MKNNIISKRFGDIRINIEIINTEKDFKWRLIGYNLESKNNKLRWQLVACSSWSSCYESILVQPVCGRIFAYASAYWENTLPFEVPFEIVEGIPA